jgi:hypothetical protein
MAGGVVPARSMARVWAGDADPSAFNVHQVLPVDIDGRVVELPIDALEAIVRISDVVTFNLPYYRGWRRSPELGGAMHSLHGRSRARRAAGVRGRVR